MRLKLLLPVVLGFWTLAPWPLIGPSLAFAATDASVTGIVTDHAGHPIRGAIVKATLAGKSIARYSGDDGHYSIGGLAMGQHEVSVEAFGFAPSTKTAGAKLHERQDFKLSPRMDLAQLTTAEMRYLLPNDNKDVMGVYYTCSDCHGFQTALHRTGLPQLAWAAFLPAMTIARFGAGILPPAAGPALAPKVTLVFGPDGIFGPNATPDFSKVRHTPLMQKALKATITEYAIPSPLGQPHSVRVDQKNGMVWFADYDSASNDIYRFDPKTESFHRYKNPLPSAQAHTGAILPDGSYIVGCDAGTFDKGPTPVKLVIAHPDGSIEPIAWPEKKQGTRVPILDPTRPDVVWIVAGPETWSYNVRTKQFRAYQNPKPAKPPLGSYEADFGFGPPGQPPDSAGYDVTVDSKGFPWVSQLRLGTIFRLDPASGETKIFHTSDMFSARGITVDAQDNIWFADYYHNKVGVLDPKTGAVKFYRPPNPYASPYGVSIDPRRGYVWYTDNNGNNVSRLDPKTGEFVEYHLPTANASDRFLGIDPQGRVWYGGFWNQKLGVIDPGDEGNSNVTAAR
ncbi:MAG TPA: carboxypeptidase regulatory-like domain-containing protein [Steroidobacteraceae bacterium]